MREFGLKLCVFLFLVAAFSGHANELGTLTGAITGTILFWPIYRKLLPAPASPAATTSCRGGRPGGSGR